MSCCHECLISVALPWKVEKRAVVTQFSLVYFVFTAVKLGSGEEIVETRGECQAGDGDKGGKKIWRKHFYIRKQISKIKLRKTFNISKSKMLCTDVLIYCKYHIHSWESCGWNITGNSYLWKNKHLYQMFNYSFKYKNHMWMLVCQSPCVLGDMSVT